MAEESVRVANAAVAQALQAVKDAEVDVKKWNERIESDLSNPKLLRERTEANERLKEARESII